MSDQVRAESIIDYQSLFSDAVRGMVLKILARVAQEGRLPGNHYFYLTFDTTHPDTYIPRYLRTRHPKHMTIVLQHEFENLRVTSDAIQVTLRFSSQREDIRIPAAAILKFVDGLYPDQKWIMYGSENQIHGSSDTNLDASFENAGNTSNTVDTGSAEHFGSANHPNIESIEENVVRARFGRKSDKTV